MKSTILTSAALAVSTFGLAACGGDAPAEETNGPAGIEVSDARLALPPVPGNPSAIYMSVENSSDRAVMLRAGSVEGMGNYMIHEVATWEGKPSMDEIMQLPIRAGETVTLSPGKMHLMTASTPEDAAAGGKVTVTLSFVGGKTMEVEADVIAAGDDRAAPSDDADEEAEV